MRVSNWNILIPRLFGFSISLLLFSAGLIASYQASSIPMLIRLLIVIIPTYLLVVAYLGIRGMVLGFSWSDEKIDFATFHGTKQYTWSQVICVRMRGHSGGIMKVAVIQFSLIDGKQYRCQIKQSDWLKIKENDNFIRTIEGFPDM